MSAQKLREAFALFGPAMVQVFGQSEALMMMTILSTADHIEALNNPTAESRCCMRWARGPLVRRN